MKVDQDIAAILSILEQAATKIGPFPVSAQLLDSWQRQLAVGQPALNQTDFPVAEAALLLADTVGVCENKVLPVFRAEQLLAGYLSGQIAADWKEYGITPERGKAYIHLSCQTALARTAKAVVEAVSLAGWEQHHCPVCGDDPAFSCLEKEGGHRELVCGACQTSWRSKRIGCAYCGEEQPDRLKVLTADEFPGWSVGVCMTCHGYIKIADLRQLAVTPRWQKATLDTLPLDYAAIKWLTTAPQATI